MSINWNEKEFEEIFIEAVREALNWLEYYLYCLHSRGQAVKLRFCFAIRLIRI